MESMMMMCGGKYVVSTTTNSSGELSITVVRAYTNNIVLVAVGGDDGILVRGVYACSQTDIACITRVLSWLMV